MRAERVESGLACGERVVSGFAGELRKKFAGGKFQNIKFRSDFSLNLLLLKTPAKQIKNNFRKLNK